MYAATVIHEERRMHWIRRRTTCLERKTTYTLSLLDQKKDKDDKDGWRDTRGKGQGKWTLDHSAFMSDVESGD